SVGEADRVPPAPAGGASSPRGESRTGDQPPSGAVPARLPRRQSMRPDTIALWLAVVPAVAFVVIYLLELRYVRFSAEAQHLIGFTSVLALILIEELLRRIFLRGVIPLEMHRVFVAVTVAAAAAYLWQRLYMLLKYQVLPR